MSQVDAETANSKSTQTFITALVLGLAVAGAQTAAFISIRRKFPRIYQPKSIFPLPSHRTPALPQTLLGFLPAILKTSDQDIIRRNGLDAYLFVRFLWLMLEIFVPAFLLTWPILLPVDSVKSGGTNSGLNIFTFGNVGQTQQPRYAAHLILAYILTFWVLYILRREYGKFVTLRQDFLTSKDWSSKAQSKTVLVTGIPRDYLNEESLRKVTANFPGGVARVWINKDIDDLNELYERRTKACNKLESAETKAMKLANKRVTKKKVDAPTAGSAEKNDSLLNSLIPAKKRPSHRLGKIPFFGKKVDTIDWCSEEIANTNKELVEKRGQLDRYRPLSSAFIYFNDQLAAHMFAQTLASEFPLHMTGRYINVDKEDVIWSTLNINPYAKKVRYAGSWAMTLGLIILWSFPVAFVGLISNVSQLCISAPWLAWLCRLPTPVNGIIQGALPPIALAVLMALLPIVLRLFALFEGIPMHSLIELSLMTRYFLFLVIHSFLIVTLASGLVAAIPQISQNPGSAVTLLAQKLPLASIFFLTYMVTVGLSGAAGGLLQIARLAIYYIKIVLLGGTPRKVFALRNNMDSVKFGTAFPKMTLLTVIGLAYSIIAPVMCGFVMLTFALFWFVYKYLFLWVYDQPASMETGGLFYRSALTHIFVGLYIEELCLTGLFFLAQNANGKQSAIPQGALMVVLIVITAACHIMLNKGYGPLVKYLPLSLGDKMRDQKATNAQTGEALNPAVTQQSRHSGEEKAGLAANAANAGRHERDVEMDNMSSNTRTPPNMHQGTDKHDGAGHTQPGPDSNEELDRHAFDNPAAYEHQRTVWLASDELGIAKQEMSKLRAAGVDVSDAGATMDSKGKVNVSRSPPGEDWEEGAEA